MKFEVEIGEYAMKKLRSEITVSALTQGDGMDLKTKALYMMLRAWDDGEVATINSKEDVDNNSEDQ